MSIDVVIDLHVKPEYLEQMKAVLKEALPHTRAYDGCQGVDCVENADDAINLIIIDKWVSRAHYDKYAACRAESDPAGAFLAMLESEPSTRICKPVDA